MDKLHRSSLFTCRVFVLLYEHLSAKAVAEELQISPSCVTRTLNQYRDQLEDPLFVRKRYGFQPTALAHCIYPKLKQVVAQLTVLEQLNAAGRHKAGQ